MIQLTGKLLYESNDSPHQKDWLDLSPETRAMFDRAARNLDRTIHHEEAMHLLIDYKAQLDKVCAMFSNADIKFVNAQLLERCASTCAWTSEEERICESCNKHVPRPASNEWDQLLEVADLRLCTECVQSQGYQPVTAQQMQAYEQWKKTQPIEEIDPGLQTAMAQLAQDYGFSGAWPIIETKLTEERQTD